MESMAQPGARYVIAPPEDSPAPVGVDPHTPLWRYIDLAKLVSLLDSSALFFARADLLGDPFEGSITAHRLELRRESEAEQRRRGLAVKMTSHSRALVETNIPNTIISCWHMNEVESAAMWRLYPSGNEGVAIRSSCLRLLASLPRTPTRQRVLPGGWNRVIFVRGVAVSYIDFAKAKTGLADPFLFKRASFAHERELRLIAQDRSMQGEPRPSRFPAGGDYVPVRLRKLIKAVHVAPTAPRWFADVVRGIVVRYGLRSPVVQSALSDSPLH